MRPRVAERFAQLRGGRRAREMALLLGTMTRASVYQEALRDAGFEHRDGRIGVRPERRRPNLWRRCCAWQ
ncbi:MAG: hypothetical protein ACLUE1_01400 [Adlercreutzia equolifaciens]